MRENPENMKTTLLKYFQIIIDYDDKDGSNIYN